MFAELYRYFIHHNELIMPGIGIIKLNKKSAVADFPSRQILPPVYSISLEPNNSNTPDMAFFDWMGKALSISIRDAIVQFNNFSFELKQTLNAGEKVNWDGIGTLSKGAADEIRFEPLLTNHSFETAVRAGRVIRENALHTVRVGEDEKNSAEMIELLGKSAAPKKKWWVAVLILCLLFVLFLIWYFSTQSSFSNASGSQLKINSTTATATYKIVS